MKKIIRFTLFMIISLLVAGCNSNEDAQSNANSEEEVSQSSEDYSEESELKVEKTNLNMGETAELSTTVGDFSLTLEDAEEKTEIDGQQSQLDIFVLTEWKVENISEEPIEVNDAIGGLHLYNEMRGSGTWWILLENDEEWKGELQPGESATGELKFEIEDTEEYSAGMEYASADSELKEVMWNFTIED
ncbi:DUF4352 domain-containing protein [Thalassobacillus hwangdonensis]|uniref:DUF4352 domain-containing protein n=1 Tax=Thalassobacillus hwangdonensis TaxID=546108 RepID=A0ABW3KUY9_9BACI